MRQRMARKRRSGRRLLKGVIDEAMSLGTIANAVAVSQIYDETVNERTYVISQESTYSIRNAAANEGPVIVGFAHSDYSTAEIEEYIENAGAWNEGDQVAQEVSRRKIRIVGALTANVSSGGDISLNDGNPIKTKVGWVLTQGQSLQQFAYNNSGAALTTGSDLVMMGHVWLRPTG